MADPTPPADPPAPPVQELLSGGINHEIGRENEIRPRMVANRAQYMLEDLLDHAEAIKAYAMAVQQYAEDALAEAKRLLGVEEAARIADVNAEEAARQNADTALQGNIDAEATARQNADANLQNQINARAPTASPALTGNPTAPTPATSDNDTSVATTAFVRSAISTYAPQTDVSGYAPLNSPNFSGDPRAPNPSFSDYDTTIATTKWAWDAANSAANTAAGSKVSVDGWIGNATCSDAGAGNRSQRVASTEYVMRVEDYLLGQINDLKTRVSNAGW